jgi:hypothetical protein
MLSDIALLFGRYLAASTFKRELLVSSPMILANQQQLSTPLYPPFTHFGKGALVNVLSFIPHFQPPFKQQIFRNHKTFATTILLCASCLFPNCTTKEFAKKAGPSLPGFLFFCQSILPMWKF